MRYLHFASWIGDYYFTALITAAVARRRAWQCSPGEMRQYRREPSSTAYPHGAYGHATPHADGWNSRPKAYGLTSADLMAISAASLAKGVGSLNIYAAEYFPRWKASQSACC